MVKILLERYLSITLLIVGAAGVAQSVGAWVGWLWGSGLFVVALILASIQPTRDRARSRVQNQRIRQVADYLAQQIDVASTFDYRPRHLDDLPVDEIAREVERWKESVEEHLGRELPGAYADVRFGKAFGELGLGQGPARIEHSRLIQLRSHLMAILDNLPAYVERSLR